MTVAMNTLTQETEIGTEVLCYHCGQQCDDVRWEDDKPFCCTGCQAVFEILQRSDLCDYYSLDDVDHPSLRHRVDGSFQYLDDEKIRQRLLSFDSDQFAKVKFHIPAIHCISCIWLLENLQKIEGGILRAEVDFTRRNVTIDFKPDEVKLSSLAGLLSTLGYEPKITLAGNDYPDTNNVDRGLVYKLAIAGFCFGNVMLFSFPEYLGLDSSDRVLSRIFSLLNIALSLPVLLYSASGYFKAAALSFRQRRINIDVPIAAGLIALFSRSVFDIITASGPGYLDSFTGLVFFLLIGRWFQSKTYESLAFDRDFKSYFPLAIQKWFDDDWKPVLINELEEGDKIRVRNMEIVPADSELLDTNTYVDYSFVTGESRPVLVMKGQTTYAGGRLVGAPALFRVVKRTSQSQLTELWNNDVFRKNAPSRYQEIIDRAARVFTWAVMGIAAVTALYWQIQNPAQMWLVLTSVLMVACPCALALAAPFTYGTMLRAFGRNQFYLKNAQVIEKLSTIDAVVFDKTGTITYGSTPEVSFSGVLTPPEWRAVKLITGASTHPLSSIISRSISGDVSDTIESFREIAGRGIMGEINNLRIQIGSSALVGVIPVVEQEGSTVYVSIDGDVKGYFVIRTSVRRDMKYMLDRLAKKCVALLSGDNDSDKHLMSTLFTPSVELLFNQTPRDKLAFVRELQKKGKHVMMVGDGLNDSGALKQSDVGIAITDDTGVFTPACDGILAGEEVNMLDTFLALSKQSVVILKTAFGISFLYNAIALSFAVTGNLTPIVAAVLMPLSSISVVAFSSAAVNYSVNKKIKK